VLTPDTKYVPNSGPTVASRTCMVVGKLVGQAAENLRQEMHQAGFLKTAYSDQEFVGAGATYLKAKGALKASAQYRQPEGIFWDDKKYEGEAYATFAWAVYVAEVSVDLVSYAVQVDDFVALQEIGKVVHPILAAGQIEGGVVQGIGFAIYEKVVWKNGSMANNSLTNYIIPTPADVPPIRVYFTESPTAHGPQGAKGIGELPMDGAGPAVINAIENATGLQVNKMPFLPEDLWQELQAQHV